MTEDRVELPSGITTIVLPNNQGEWRVDLFEFQKFLETVSKDAEAGGHDYYWQLDRVREYAARENLVIGKAEANYLFFMVPKLVAKKNSALLSDFTGTLAYPGSTGSGPAPSPKPSEPASN